ncbi:uncharacterized protein NMK_2806 [Novimethylophilus kurashikiensis]|uniref:Zona occludens toxin N-terminal domain-containing protein n=1 Tax=Novimethylophilus kurashikiensis TaxID=1825523 RepID=A0A2R5FER4_9PROT|nr:zonular occludens toxin domain-containing protein [Novimethylophilus kurashikiensis]GBG15203.1 uncharacterized protein NMK_2806 [Novimethylophilus kurashikiensis]
MIYIITGKLGAGKSLLAVQRAIDYALEGRRVAANFPMDFAPICRTPTAKIAQAYINVLPAIPTVADLKALGVGGEHEETAGALLLDECAQFLNSRQWQGKEREEIINWLLHARKLKWDVFLIIQHERMLDKQVRDALAEYVVTVRRTDRLQVPFMPFKLPRIHIGTVRYGLEANALVADRWFTRGALPMQCYDTGMIFQEETPQYCTLPATITKFRSSRNKPLTWYEALRLVPAFLLAHICKLFKHPVPVRYTPPATPKPYPQHLEDARLLHEGKFVPDWAYDVVKSAYLERQRIQREHEDRLIAARLESLKRKQQQQRQARLIASAPYLDDFHFLAENETLQAIQRELDRDTDLLAA